MRIRHGIPTLLLAAAIPARDPVVGGSEGLSDLRGVLAIEGTVDLMSGLSVYGYSGRVH